MRMSTVWGSGRRGPSLSTKRKGDSWGKLSFKKDPTPKKTYQLASCQATATIYSQGQPFVLPKHTEEKHSAHATIRQVSWVVH